MRAEQVSYHAGLYTSELTLKVKGKISRDMTSVLRWDPEKARSNARKHGVAFVEAASVLRDLSPLPSATRFIRPRRVGS